MMCPICGGTVERSEETSRDAFAIFRTHRCVAGHKFPSVQVHTPLLADSRDIASAQRNILSRIARYKRDSAIAADVRPAKIVAQDFGITPARVRQIRASFQPNPFATESAKIQPAT